MFKKIFFLFLLAYQCISAQNYNGFIDNYSGISAVKYNPSAIVDTPYKLDVNLFSSSINLGNNYAFFDLKNEFKRLFTDEISDITSDFYNLSSFSNFDDSRDDHSFYGNFEIQGPSFLYNINRKVAVGAGFRIRGLFNASNINGNLYDDIINKNFIDGALELENNEAIDFKGSATANIFSELSVTGAFLLYQTSQKIVKFGTTLKLFNGLYTVNTQFNDVKATLNTDDRDNPTANLTGKVINSANTIFNGNDIADKIAENIFKNNFGFGFDLGFTYEYRNRVLPKIAKDKNGEIYYKKAPYTYKLAFAITDIGNITYDNVSKSEFVTDQTITEDVNVDLIAFIRPNTPFNQTISYLLPTTSHLNIDYNYNDKFFLNGNLDVSIINSKALDQNRYQSAVTITPRYESKKFSAFLPVSINQHQVFRAGVGLRTPYFFIGSSSLLSNLITESQEFEFNMGIKLPFFIKSKKRKYKFKKKSYYKSNQ